MVNMGVEFNVCGLSLKHFVKSRAYALYNTYFTNF